MSYPIIKPLVTFWWIGFILIGLLFLTGCEADYWAVFPEKHGQAKVSISTDPLYLKWELEIKNLDMVTAAHIHCLPSRAAGVSLSSAVFNLDGANIKGIAVSGTALTPDKGNFCGWLTIKDVQKSIQEGMAFINIHTYSQPAGAVEAPLKSAKMMEAVWDRLLRARENRSD